MKPIGIGPLKLSRVQCIEVNQGTFNRVLPPTPSPDGSSFFVYDVSHGLWIGSLNSKTPIQHFEADVTGLNFSDSGKPFAWFGKGHSVLAVTQNKMKPRGGWALGPLRPFLASKDGKRRALPVLENSAGPLDEIHWVGDAGLAIALFGAKGRYYRPEHSDPEPTIALVDALKRRVIQSAPLADLVPNAQNTHIAYVGWQVEARTQRIQSLISLAPDRWFLWRQGEKPRRVPIGVKPWRTLFALTPDGKAVLAMRNLSATGMICEHNPQCPPPTPSTGPIAELREIESGRIIWSVVGTANGFSNDGVPVISPNGRYAMISMPTNTAAIIDMALGKVLQEIPSLGPYRTIIGFSADSQEVWISGSGRIVTYGIGDE